MKKVKTKTCDVAVIGGGPGGLPAAIQAARMGKTTILVERNSFLGGTATSGLGILGYLDRQGRKAPVSYTHLFSAAFIFDIETCVPLFTFFLTEPFAIDKFPLSIRGNRDCDIWCA